MKFGADGSKTASRPPVSGSQNFPSARFTSAVGRRTASGHSTRVPSDGLKCATLNPPSSVIQNVPSASFRSEPGAVSVANVQRDTVVRSGESLARALSAAETLQTVPSSSRTTFAPSVFPAFEMP